MHIYQRLTDVTMKAIAPQHRIAVLEAIQSERPIQWSWFDTTGKDCFLAVACRVVSGNNHLRVRNYQQAARILGIDMELADKAVGAWDNLTFAERDRYLDRIIPLQLARLRREMNDAPIVPIKKNLPVGLRVERVLEIVAVMFFILFVH